MCLALVKKDLKILFAENTGMLLVQFLFILVICSMNLGIAGYFILTVAAAWQMLMVVSAKEQSTGALALLLSASYSEFKIVGSRYLSAVILFVVITVGYSLLSFVTGQLGLDLFQDPTWDIILMAFLSYMMFVSITLPLYFFLEDMTVRIISIALIFGVFFTVYFLVRFTNVAAILSGMEMLNKFKLPGVLLLTAIVMVISMAVTTKILKRLEF